jgi:hypothetical protein
VTETNFDRLRLLPDRSLGSLHRFRDFHRGCSRLRIGFELPDVVLSPRTANGGFFFGMAFLPRGTEVRIIVARRERFDLGCLLTQSGATDERRADSQNHSRRHGRFLRVGRAAR